MAYEQRTMNRKQLGHVEVCWNPPSTGWVKLNMDAATNLEANGAGCGGLLRDETRRWIWGFSRPLGSYTAFTTECWGILCGLQEAWRRGFKKVQVECDSKALVHSISDEGQHQNHLI